MPGYPCCCTDKNSLYVPCCLYGISFQVFGRTVEDTGKVKLKHLYLENALGDASADHGSVMTYSDNASFDGVTYGSPSWYDWGLPVSLENLFEAQPGGNWKIRMTFRNIGLNSITLEIKECVLGFSFFKPLGAGYAQYPTLYPNSVGGGGWNDTINLIAPGGVASVVIPGRSNSPELLLVYGELPIGAPGNVKTSIDTTRRPFLAFNFPEEGGPGTAAHCLEFMKATDEAERDNAGEQLIINCEVSPPCVECSCRAARPDSQGTCDDCRCVSNTPLKIGGFGETAPEPSIIDITGEDNGKGVGQEWTVYGHGKILGDNLTDWQTLLWVGYEDIQGNVPMTGFSLQRRIVAGTPTDWYLWVVGLNNALTFTTATDITVDGSWFVWWVVKKTDGGVVRYKLGIAPHAGGASISDWIEAADMDFPGPGSDFGDWAILGDDPEFSLFPNFGRLDASYAGCIDGLSFKDSAATDEEMLALAHCSVSPPP